MDAYLIKLYTIIVALKTINKTTQSKSMFSLKLVININAKTQKDKCKLDLI